MKDFIHSVKFKVLVGILAVLLGLSIYTAATSSEGSFVSSFIGVIISPFQKLSSSISVKVSDTLDMFSNAKDYYEENQQLKKQLNDYYNKMVDYDRISEENKHYKEMLKLKEEYTDLQFSPPCQIIGRVTNDIYQSFFIDKGSNDGISLHDPVITEDGLVGIIDSVEKTYSRVTTILSYEYPIGVYCSRTKETGVIEGNFESGSNGVTIMRYIDKDSSIEKGDIIVTSGHSGLVPRGRTVGIVESVDIAENGLSLEAVINPVVDISGLSNVFVITDFEGQGDGYNE